MKNHLSPLFLVLMLFLTLAPVFYAGPEKRIETGAVVEWLVVIDPETKMGTYTHVCCDCELTHGVEVRVGVREDGKLVVVNKWITKDFETHKRRTMRFGSGYRSPDPFGVRSDDPWRDK
jgi:hypothetical protein